MVLFTLGPFGALSKQHTATFRILVFILQILNVQDLKVLISVLWYRERNSSEQNIKLFCLFERMQVPDDLCRAQSRSSGSGYMTQQECKSYPHDAKERAVGS